MRHLKLVIGIFLIVSLLAGNAQAVKVETRDEGFWQTVIDVIAHELSVYKSIPVQHQTAVWGVPPEEYWP